MRINIFLSLWSLTAQEKASVLGKLDIEPQNKRIELKSPLTSATFFTIWRSRAGLYQENPTSKGKADIELHLSSSETHRADNPSKNLRISYHPNLVVDRQQLISHLTLAYLSASCLNILRSKTFPNLTQDLTGILKQENIRRMVAHFIAKQSLKKISLLSKPRSLSPQQRELISILNSLILKAKRARRRFKHTHPDAITRLSYTSHSTEESIPTAIDIEAQRNRVRQQERSPRENHRSSQRSFGSLFLDWTSSTAIAIPDIISPACFFISR